MMTVQEVKALIQINQADESRDSYLTTILPCLVEYCQNYCKQDFKDEAGVVQLPQGVKLAIAQMAQYNMKDNGINSERGSNYSVTYETDFPQSILIMLNPYISRKITFR